MEVIQCPSIKIRKKRKLLKGKGRGGEKKRIQRYLLMEKILVQKGQSKSRKLRVNRGVLGTEKVYGLQKDARTKSWSDEAKDLGIKDIRLCGNPEKDKVDKKIQKDIRKEIKNNKSVDIVCIATSDKGYTETVKELRRQGKRVVGIGERKAPKELRDACSEFIEIE